MRLSILTQPLGHNYGGLLQAYALQTYLKRIGCDVETLDRRAPRPLRSIYKRHLMNVSKLALGRIKSLPTSKRWAFVYQELEEFRDKNLSMSPAVKSESQLREYYLKNKFDAVLVGSDQVWRPLYSPSLLNYYLDFLDDTNSTAKRIAYAASFGVGEWEYDDDVTEACRILLAKFDGVSVRESSAVNLCQKHLGVTPEWVVDPTLLLESSDYEQLWSDGSESGSAGKILGYILDPTDDYKQIAQGVAATLGRELFLIKPEEEITQVRRRELHRCQYPSVELWLKSFKDAHYVVTDSFHGCVFSIIFNKPFIAIGNRKRGMARFDSLLSMFGLENRLISSPSQFLSGVLEATIDWQSVNSLRQQHAERSKAFLRRVIYTGTSDEPA